MGEFREKDLRFRTAMWISGIAIALMVGLVGIIYSNVEKDIEKKANKETVILIQENLDKKLDNLQIGVNKLEQLYIQHLQQMSQLNATIKRK